MKSDKILLLLVLSLSIAVSNCSDTVGLTYSFFDNFESTDTTINCNETYGRMGLYYDSYPRYLVNMSFVLDRNPSTVTVGVSIVVRNSSGDAVASQSLGNQADITYGGELFSFTPSNPVYIEAGYYILIEFYRYNAQWVLMDLDEKNNPLGYIVQSYDGSEYVTVGEYVMQANYTFIEIPYLQITGDNCLDFGDIKAGIDSDPLTLNITNNNDFETIIISDLTLDSNFTLLNDSISGESWLTQDSSRNWYDIAMSSNGSVRTAVVSGGYIYVSYDFGETYSAKSSSRTYRSVSISSDGVFQITGVYGGYVYFSNDSGVTWYETAPSKTWRDVAISDDGVYMLAVEYDAAGNVWTSNDSGITWYNHSFSRAFYSADMSRDGTYQTVTSSSSGYIYVSNDSGVTWYQRAISTNWRGVAVSDNGSIQSALDYSGYVYMSFDYGVTWDSRTLYYIMDSIDINSDGSVLIVGTYTYEIEVSYDYGTTWNIVNTGINKQWRGVAVSGNGVYMSGAPYGDYLYVNDNYLLPQTSRLLYFSCTPQLYSDSVHNTSISWSLYDPGYSTLQDESYISYKSTTPTVYFETLSTYSEVTLDSFTNESVNAYIGVETPNDVYLVLSSYSNMYYVNNPREILDYVEPNTRCFSYSTQEWVVKCTDLPSNDKQIVVSLWVNSPNTVYEMLVFAGGSTPGSMLESNTNIYQTGRSKSLAGGTYYEVVGVTDNTYANGTYFVGIYAYIDGMSEIDDGGSHPSFYRTRGGSWTGRSPRSTGFEVATLENILYLNSTLNSSFNIYAYPNPSSYGSIDRDIRINYLYADCPSFMSFNHTLSINSPPPTFEISWNGQLNESDCGDVAVDQDHIFNLTISNTGINELYISDINYTFNNSLFSQYISLNTTLSQNESINLTFNFNPDAFYNQYQYCLFSLNASNLFGLITPQTILIYGKSTTPNLTYSILYNYDLGDIQAGIESDVIIINITNYGSPNYISTDAYYTTAGLSGNFLGIDISADGKYQTVGRTSYNPIHSSFNYGYTWSEQYAYSIQHKDYVAMSSDGRLQYVNRRAGAIFKSTNYGQSWAYVSSSLFGDQINDISCSSDGQYIVMATQTWSGDYKYYILTSQDNGTSWSQKGDLHLWYGAAVSGDGSIITGTSGDGVYASYDYGSSWTQVSTITTGREIAMSDSGQYQVFAVTSGYLYFSSNYGLNWSTVGYSLSNQYIDMSKDGKIIVSADNGGYIYISKDYGVSWDVVYNESALSWRGIAVSDDGSIISSCISGGDIYTFRSIDNRLNLYNSSNITILPNSNYLYYVSVTPDSYSDEIVNNSILFNFDNSYGHIHGDLAYVSYISSTPIITLGDVASFNHTDFMIYQENANVSANGGGTWHNSYKYTNTIDGNWNTFGTSFSSVCIGYVNYTKPLGAIRETSTWKVKGGEGTAYLTLPDDIWSYSDTTLILRYYITGFNLNTLWQGYNGTDWQTLRSEFCWVYEEAMNWNCSFNYYYSGNSKATLNSSYVYLNISNFESPNDIEITSFSSISGYIIDPIPIIVPGGSSILIPFTFIPDRFYDDYTYESISYTINTTYGEIESVDFIFGYLSTTPVLSFKNGSAHGNLKVGNESNLTIEIYISNFDTPNEIHLLDYTSNHSDFYIYFYPTTINASVNVTYNWSFNPSLFYDVLQIGAHTFIVDESLGDIDNESFNPHHTGYSSTPTYTLGYISYNTTNGYANIEANAEHSGTFQIIKDDSPNDIWFLSSFIDNESTYDWMTHADVSYSQYTTTNSYDSFIVGDVLFLADSSGNIKVLNITDRLNPSLISETPTATDYHNPTTIYVVDDYVYVGEGAYGISIWNASNISNLTRLFCIPYLFTTGEALEILVSGDILYLAGNQNGVYIFNVTNRSNAISIYNITTVTSSIGITLANNMLYIANGQTGVKIYDVTNPYAPVFKSTYNTPNSARCSVLDGDILYVTDYYGAKGLLVLNVSNSLSVTEIGHMAFNYTYKLVKISNVLYISTGSGLLLVDVSDPTNPQQIILHEKGYSNEFRDVQVVDGYAFACGYGLEIYKTNQLLSEDNTISFVFNIDRYRDINYTISLSLNSLNFGYGDIDNSATIIFKFMSSTPYLEIVNDNNTLNFGDIQVDTESGLYYLNISNPTDANSLILSYLNTPLVYFTSYNLSDSPPSEMLYYQLNGDATDSSASGYDGTNNGVSFVSGKFGQGAEYIASENDHIHIPDGIDDPIQNNSFTIACWFKSTDSFATPLHLFSRGYIYTGGKNYGIHLVVESSIIRIRRNEGTSTSYQFGVSGLGSVINQTGWNHLTVTYDKSTQNITMYLNGQYIGSGVRGTGAAIQYSPSYDEGYILGANMRGYSNEYSNAIIDDFVIYDVIKDASWESYIWYNGTGRTLSVEGISIAPNSYELLYFSANLPHYNDSYWQESLNISINELLGDISSEIGILKAKSSTPILKVKQGIYPYLGDNLTEGSTWNWLDNGGVGDTYVCNDSFIGNYSSAIDFNLPETAINPMFGFGWDYPLHLDLTNSDYVEFWMKINTTAVGWRSPHSLLILTSGGQYHSIDLSSYNTLYTNEWVKYDISFSQLSGGAVWSDINYVYFYMDILEDYVPTRVQVDGFHFYTLSDIGTDIRDLQANVTHNISIMFEESTGVNTLTVNNWTVNNSLYSCLNPFSLFVDAGKFTMSYITFSPDVYYDSYVAGNFVWNCSATYGLININSSTILAKSNTPNLTYSLNNIYFGDIQVDTESPMDYLNLTNFGSPNYITLTGVTIDGNFSDKNSSYNYVIAPNSNLLLYFTATPPYYINSIWNQSVIWTIDQSFGNITQDEAYLSFMSSTPTLTYSSNNIYFGDLVVNVESAMDYLNLTNIGSPNNITLTGVTIDGNFTDKNSSYNYVIAPNSYLMLYFTATPSIFTDTIWNQSVIWSINQQYGNISQNDAYLSYICSSPSLIIYGASALDFGHSQIHNETDMQYVNISNNNPTNNLTIYGINLDQNFIDQNSSYNYTLSPYESMLMYFSAYPQLYANDYSEGNKTVTWLIGTEFGSINQQSIYLAYLSLAPNFELTDSTYDYGNLKVDTNHLHNITAIAHGYNNITLIDPISDYFSSNDSNYTILTTYYFNNSIAFTQINQELDNDATSYSTAGTFYEDIDDTTDMADETFMIIDGFRISAYLSASRGFLDPSASASFGIYNGSAYFIGVSISAPGGFGGTTSGTFTYTWTTNPFTGSAWTYSDIDDLQLRLYVNEGVGSSASVSNVHTYVNRDLTMVNGDNITYTIQFHPDVYLDTPLSGNVLINVTTDYGQVHTNSTKVTGYSHTPILGLNLSMTFGNLQVDTTHNLTLTFIELGGANNLTITNWTSNNSLFIGDSPISVFVDGSSSNTTYIYFIPDQYYDVLQFAELMFNVSSSTYGFIDVNYSILSGKSATPSLHVNFSIDFGDVQVDTTHTLTITFEEKGGANNLTVDNWTINNSLFASIDPISIFVDGGNSNTTYVFFTSDKFYDTLQYAEIVWNCSPSIYGLVNGLNQTILSGKSSTPIFIINASYDFGNVIADDIYSVILVFEEIGGINNLTINNWTSNHSNFYPELPLSIFVDKGNTSNVTVYFNVSQHFTSNQIAEIMWNSSSIYGLISENYTILTGYSSIPTLTLNVTSHAFGDLQVDIEYSYAIEFSATGNGINLKFAANHSDFYSDPITVIQSGSSNSSFVYFLPSLYYDSTQGCNITWTSAGIVLNYTILSGKSTTPTLTYQKSCIDFGTIPAGVESSMDYLNLTNYGSPNNITITGVSLESSFNAKNTSYNYVVMPNSNLLLYFSATPDFHDTLWNQSVNWSFISSYGNVVWSQGYLAYISTAPELTITGIHTLSFGDVKVAMYSDALFLNLTNSGSLNNITIENTIQYINLSIYGSGHTDPQFISLNESLFDFVLQPGEYVYLYFSALPYTYTNASGYNQTLTFNVDESLGTIITPTAYLHYVSRAPNLGVNQSLYLGDCEVDESVYVNVTWTNLGDSGQYNAIPIDIDSFASSHISFNGSYYSVSWSDTPSTNIYYTYPVRGDSILNDSSDATYLQRSGSDGIDWYEYRADLDQMTNLPTTDQIVVDSITYRMRASADWNYGAIAYAYMHPLWDGGQFSSTLTAYSETISWLTSTIYTGYGGAGIKLTDLNEHFGMRIGVERDSYYFGFPYGTVYAYSRIYEAQIQVNARYLLEPNESFSFTIRFNPTDYQTHANPVNMTSNARSSFDYDLLEFEQMDLNYTLLTGHTWMFNYSTYYDWQRSIDEENYKNTVTMLSASGNMNITVFTNVTFTVNDENVFELLAESQVFSESTFDEIGLSELDFTIYYDIYNPQNYNRNATMWFNVYLGDTSIGIYQFNHTTLTDGVATHTPFNIYWNGSLTWDGTIRMALSDTQGMEYPAYLEVYNITFNEINATDYDDEDTWNLTYIDDFGAGHEYCIERILSLDYDSSYAYYYTKESYNDTYNIKGGWGDYIHSNYVDVEYDAPETDFSQHFPTHYDDGGRLLPYDGDENYFYGEESYGAYYASHSGWYPENYFWYTETRMYDITDFDDVYDLDQLTFTLGGCFNRRNTSYYIDTGFGEWEDWDYIRVRAVMEDSYFSRAYSQPIYLYESDFTFEGLWEPYSGYYFNILDYPITLDLEEHSGYVYDVWQVGVEFQYYFEGAWFNDLPNFYVQWIMDDIQITSSNTGDHNEDDSIELEAYLTRNGTQADMGNGARYEIWVTTSNITNVTKTTTYDCTVTFITEQGKTYDISFSIDVYEPIFNYNIPTTNFGTITLGETVSARFNFTQSNLAWVEYNYSWEGDYPNDWYISGFSGTTNDSLYVRNPSAINIIESILHIYTDAPQTPHIQFSFYVRINPIYTTAINFGETAQGLEYLQVYNTYGIDGVQCELDFADTEEFSYSLTYNSNYFTIDINSKAELTFTTQNKHTDLTISLRRVGADPDIQYKLNNDEWVDIDGLSTNWTDVTLSLLCVDANDNFIPVNTITFRVETGGDWVHMKLSSQTSANYSTRFYNNVMGWYTTSNNIRHDISSSDMWADYTTFTIGAGSYFIPTIYYLLTAEEFEVSNITGNISLHIYDEDGSPYRMSLYIPFTVYPSYADYVVLISNMGELDIVLYYGESNTFNIQFENIGTIDDTINFLNCSISWLSPGYYYKSVKVDTPINISFTASSIDPNLIGEYVELEITLTTTYGGYFSESMYIAIDTRPIFVLVQPTDGTRTITRSAGETKTTSFTIRNDGEGIGYYTIYIIDPNVSIDADTNTLIYKGFDLELAKGQEGVLEFEVSGDIVSEGEVWYIEIYENNELVATFTITVITEEAAQPGNWQWMFILWIIAAVCLVVGLLVRRRLNRKNEIDKSEITVRDEYNFRKEKQGANERKGTSKLQLKVMGRRILMGIIFVSIAVLFLIPIYLWYTGSYQAAWSFIPGLPS